MTTTTTTMNYVASQLRLASSLPMPIMEECEELTEFADK